MYIMFQDVYNGRYFYVNLSLSLVTRGHFCQLAQQLMAQSSLLPFSMWHACPEAKTITFCHELLGSVALSSIAALIHNCNKMPSVMSLSHCCSDFSWHVLVSASLFSVLASLLPVFDMQIVCCQLY